MKKIVLSLLFIVIGFVAGVGVTVLVYPFIFPPPVVNERVHNVQAKQAVLKGQFIHPNPSDPVHYGKGTVTVYRLGKQHEIFLHKNFKVGPGPAFYVYLSESAGINTKAKFKKAKTIELQGLKSFFGSQVYLVPKSVDMSKIKSVVVWCKVFKQLITSANLI